MKTRPYTYRKIHALVDQKPNMFWDGWTVVVVDTRRHGIMQKNGIFFNGKWHIAHRVEPESDGTWSVPVRYV